MPPGRETMEPVFEAVPLGGITDLAHAAGEWRRFLAEADVEAGVFCDPSFIEHANPFAHGDTMLIVTGRADGRLVCVIPFRLSRERQRLPAGPWKVPFLVTRVLLLGDFEFAIRAGLDRFPLLLQAVRYARTRTQADLVLVDNVPTSGRTDAESRAGGWVFRDRQTTYVVRLPGSFSTYWATITSSVRRGFERRRKRLNQQCHDALLLRKFKRPEDMPELQGHMTRVWQKSWHANFGRYKPPAVAALEGMAGAGWMQSYVLTAGEIPIAYQLGYFYRGTYYCDAVAFDSEWREFSPGKILSLLLLEDLFGEAPPRVVDFGFGFNEYKRDLGTHDQERAKATAALSLRGRAALSAVRMAERANESGRALLKKAGLHKKLRDQLHATDASAKAAPVGGNAAAKHRDTGGG